MRGLTVRYHLENLGVDSRIIKWILPKAGGGHGLNWCGSELEQVVGSFECGNELPGSIQCGETFILDVYIQSRLILFSQLFLQPQLPPHTQYCLNYKYETLR